MSDQNRRELAHDEPENVQSNKNDFRESRDKEKRNDKEKIAKCSGQDEDEEVSRSLFEKALFESSDLIRRIDKFNEKSSKMEQDYNELQDLFSRHIRPNIHPIACSDTGEFLLRNGKFIVAFIEIMTRNQKRDFLKKYLFNYFHELDKITREKQAFTKARDLLMDRIVVSSKRGNNQDEKKSSLVLSPSSSRNQANWSTKVEKDTNSPFISSVFDSEHGKKSGEKLKRRYINAPPMEVTQQQERSQKVTKSRKKGPKSTKKTKPSNTAAQSKSKGKNQQKKTLTKSRNKLQTKSIEEIVNQGEQNNEKGSQEEKLGSCYHYYISLNPKSLQKQLKQVRTSARLSSRGPRVSITKQSLRKSVRKGRKSNSKSKSKSKRKNKNQSESEGESQSKSKSKSKSKKTRKRNEEPEPSVQEVSQNTNDNSSYQNEPSQQWIRAQWIKDHLTQINVRKIELETNFKALTKDDQKITDFLRSIEDSEEATKTMVTKSKRKSNRKSSSKKKKEQKKEQDSKPAEQLETHAHGNNESFFTQGQDEAREPIQMVEVKPEPKEEQSKSKNKRFSEIKRNYQIEELPTVVQYVINPDLNNHGIYALIKLGRVTEIEMGTAFAVTPLTYATLFNRRHILQDIQSAKKESGITDDNLGYIPMNEEILFMVNEKKKQRLSHKN